MALGWQKHEGRQQGSYCLLATSFCTHAHWLRRNAGSRWRPFSPRLPCSCLHVYIHMHVARHNVRSLSLHARQYWSSSSWADLCTVTSRAYTNPANMAVKTPNVCRRPPEATFFTHVARSALYYPHQLGVKSDRKFSGSSDIDFKKFPSDFHIIRILFKNGQKLEYNIRKLVWKQFR